MAATGETFEKPGFRPEATRSVTAGLRAISASSAVCGEGDLPLPKPLKGAIVFSKNARDLANIG